MLLLAVTIGSARGADPAPPPDLATLDAEIRRHRTTGTAALVGGSAALVGGFAVLIVGRKPGELSTESQLVSDLRSATGAGLVVGGLTAALLGGSELGKARALAEQRPVALAPAVLPGGAGLWLTVTR